MGEYKIKTGFNRMDVQSVHYFISEESYWAQGVPYDIVEKSLRNSFCIGVFDEEGKQIAFARIISDRATYGYLSDVFVLKQYRGKGISKMLMEHIMNLKWVKQLRRFMLFTEDAQELYTVYGFRKISDPEKFMEITHINMYR
ncbi:GNAT family N-acetyltransferase [Sphingobacterium spiritivorum]|uniref:GNAT family N-acetyltransferase n=1 Tax=Sphingobacterium spiritivorum TaxID=258 RepID=UPI003F777BD5